MDQICTDLGSEHAALDEVVANLSEEHWNQTTAADGWDVKDTIVHLIQADMAASLAASDADGFLVAKNQIESAGLEGVFGSRDGKSGDDVLRWWRNERRKMLDVFAQRSPKDRIPWFGPDMGALSFATARLMETWSHGRDVADSLGFAYPATDRLRHVAHIGVSTRGWSYVNRGEAPPEEPIKVELVSPSGETWSWGPEEAENYVSGSAEDFCLLVTQRRHRSATGIIATGQFANEWLDIAQAFAGPATSTPKNRH